MAIELNLSGKRALITGASEGIGRAIAGRRAREGCDLYLCARNEARLDELRSGLDEAHGIDVQIHPLDLSISVNQQALAEAPSPPAPSSRSMAE